MGRPTEKPRTSKNSKKTNDSKKSKKSKKETKKSHKMDDDSSVSSYHSSDDSIGDLSDFSDCSSDSSCNDLIGEECLSPIRPKYEENCPVSAGEKKDKKIEKPVKSKKTKKCSDDDLIDAIALVNYKLNQICLATGANPYPETKPMYSGSVTGTTNVSNSGSTSRPVIIVNGMDQHLPEVFRNIEFKN